MLTRSRKFLVLGCFAACAAGRLFAGPEPISDKTMVAQPEPPECNWYVSLGGGFDVDYGTTDFVREHTIESVSGLATLHTPSTSWDDAFGTPYRIHGEFGYALGQHI